MAATFGNLTTTDAKFIGVKSFWEGLNLSMDTWREFYEFLAPVNGGASLRIASLTGIGSIPTWDGNADLTTDAPNKTNALTIDYAGYGLQVQTSKWDVLDVPDILANVSRKLGASMAYAYEERAYAGLNASFTGTYMAGSKPLFSGTHTTASVATRDNLSTVAFSAVQLLDCIRKLRVFPNYQNQFTNYADMGLTVIVSPKNEKAALEALNSSFINQGVGGTDGNGSSMQYNSIQKFGPSLVVSGQLTDDDDWFVITRTADTPFKLFERSAPNYTVDTDPDSRLVKIAVDAALQYGLGPNPDGAIGCNIA